MISHLHPSCQFFTMGKKPKVFNNNNFFWSNNLRVGQPLHMQFLLLGHVLRMQLLFLKTLGLDMQLTRWYIASKRQKIQFLGYVQVSIIVSNVELASSKNVFLKNLESRVLKFEELGLKSNSMFYQIKKTLELKPQVLSNF